MPSAAVMGTRGIFRRGKFRMQKNDDLFLVVVALKTQVFLGDALFFLKKVDDLFSRHDQKTCNY